MKRRELNTRSGWSRAIALTALITVVMTTVLTAILLFALTRPALETIQQWPQPDAISYDGGRYHLAILKMDRDWRGFPFHIGDRYGILVGSDPSNRYGHWLDFTFYPFPDSLRDHLKATTVEWTEAGVTLEPPSGHRLFIPKALFIGGR